MGIMVPLLLFILLARSPSPEGSRTSLDLPAGNSLGVAWLEEGLVVAYRPRESIEWEYRLWQASLDGPTMEELSVSDDLDCNARRYEMPARLPDGRLGYLLHCMQYSESHAITSLMTYDLSSDGKANMEIYLWPELDTMKGSYSWHPNMRHVLLSGGTLDRSASYVGVANIDAPTEEFDRLPTRNLTEYGAAYSPDGTYTTLLAAPEAQLFTMLRAISGLPASQFDLLVMRPDAAQQQVLLRSLQNATPPVWSSDGEWIALAASTGRIFKTEGLWLVRRTTGERRLLATGSFERPEWSPDGRHLAVLERTGDRYSLPDRITIISLKD
jgi:hypothetical protein